MRLDDHNRFYHKVGKNESVFELANTDCRDEQYHYYGYINSCGSWIIKRANIQASTETAIYEFVGGQSIINYLINWDTDGSYIGSLTFKRYDQIKFG